MEALWKPKEGNVETTHNSKYRVFEIQDTLDIFRRSILLEMPFRRMKALFLVNTHKFSKKFLIFRKTSVQVEKRHLKNNTI